jgi:hypothetical protein
MGIAGKRKVEIVKKIKVFLEIIEGKKKKKFRASSADLV